MFAVLTYIISKCMISYPEIDLGKKKWDNNAHKNAALARKNYQRWITLAGEAHVIFTSTQQWRSVTAAKATALGSSRNTELQLLFHSFNCQA